MLANPSGLAQDLLAASVIDDQRRDAPDAHLGGESSADVAGKRYSEQDLALAQRPLDPVDDGLGYEAGRSSVGIDFDQHWPSGPNQALELIQ